MSTFCILLKTNSKLSRECHIVLHLKLCRYLFLILPLHYSKILQCFVPILIKTIIIVLLTVSGRLCFL